MRWISLGVLVLAGVVLALVWGDVPDRWVIHWGLHDRPDGWATKSIAAAAAPLAIGLSVWVLIEVTAVWIRRSGARTPALPPELFALQATVARAAGLAVVLLTAGVALALPLLQPRSSIPIVVAALAEIAIVVGLALVWAAARWRRLRAAGVALPDGYKGVFYSNPSDRRLWVPKLIGVGWTVNFAHRLAWPVVLAFVGLPLAVVLLIARLAR